MRDAQHGVDLTDGPWPAAVIQDLPVGLLEVDALGLAVRENAALGRLLAVGTGGPAGGPALVRDRWPQLREVTAAVLAGRTVDELLPAAGRTALRVRGVPRRGGGHVDGGLLVVCDVVEPRPAVVDVRDGVGVEVLAAPRAAVEGAAPVSAGGPEVRRAGAAGAAAVRHRAALSLGRRRRPAGHPDEHAATHDPVTGLANQVLLLQCLGDALASCRAGRRVALVVVQAEPGPADDVRLHQVAARLSRLAGPHDLVARLRGARFALLLREVRAGADVEGFLGRTVEHLRRADPGSHSAAVSWPDGVGMVLADPAGDPADRDPRLVLAVAVEALERSRGSGRPVLGTELPADAEQARLAALWAYDVHDLALDDVLHGVTEVAVGACDAAAALVTFVDRDLQWVRAATGVEVTGPVDGHGPRHLTLCDRTIRGREVLVVPDTHLDPEFRESRHVGWQVGMRFYAGAPLITPEGRAVGTLCVLDVRPRDLTARQRRSLAVLAGETVAALEAHRTRG